MRQPDRGASLLSDIAPVMVDTGSARAIGVLMPLCQPVADLDIGVQDASPEPGGSRDQ